MFKRLRNLLGLNNEGGALRKQYREKPNPEDRTLEASLDKNKKVLAEIFDHCEDLVSREFLIGEQGQTRALAVFFDSLVDHVQLQEDLLQPLMGKQQVPSTVTLAWLQQEAIPAAIIMERNRWLDVANEITKGRLALFIDGQNSALMISILDPDNRRAVDQPVSESVARGSLDAFNEDGRTNLALVRKRLRSTRLAVEKVEVGAISKLTIYVVYLKGIVMPGLVEEVKARLKHIKTDVIMASGMIEEYINDNPYSPFSGFGVSERPDRIVSRLTQGGAALIFDGTPYSLIFPGQLVTEVQSPDDYYNRYWFGSFIRVLRWGGLFIALLGPAFYIAITTFHQELIPTDLLMAILASRGNIPFPGLVEVMLVTLAFEILQEAGIRLPRPFGQTIGVVGAILIGQVAVNASLASPTVVVVAALTAISTYTIPSLNLSAAVRVLRYFFMIAAGVFGLFGIAAGLTVLTFHLCALRSFGVPYLSPFAPVSLGDLKDSLIRVPAWMMNLRPRLTGYAEPQRQEPDNRPRPPEPRD